VSLREFAEYQRRMGAAVLDEIVELFRGIGASQRSGLIVGVERKTAQGPIRILAQIRVHYYALPDQPA